MTPGRRCWLLGPALALYAADIGLTLAGQPAGYWRGDFASAVEVNPLAHPLLAAHPLVFAGAAAVWAVAFSVVILCGPPSVAKWSSYSLALGHAIGGGTWLARHGTSGWVAAVVYLFAASWLAGICWRRASRPTPAGAIGRVTPV